MEGSAHSKLTPPSRVRRVATGLLISLITVVIILAMVELVAYAWERRTAQESQGWTLVASRRMPLQQRGANGQTYGVLTPNQSYNWEGIPVHINSRGLRSDEIETPKPEDRFRILNIGDSIAFGWEVNLEETYGQELQRLLNQRDDGRHYEVINAGVPGWTLTDEVNFLEHEGITYDPDAIILEVTLVNDVYPAAPDAVAGPGLFSWLRDHTYMWPFLTTQARFLLARQIGPEAIPVLNPPQKAAAYFPLDEGSPVWSSLWESIEEIHAIAQERDIPLVVVAFPTAFQLNKPPHPDVPQRVLGSKAAAAGITFVDMLPVYQEACEQADPMACEGYENLLFADVWMHPNELGHQLAAEALLSNVPIE